jgi:hypothetical protein
MNVLQAYMIVMAAIAFTAAGCGSDTGPDNISSLQGSGSKSALGCTEKCHNSSNAGSPDPLVTNGTGTAGKHIRHVQERGITCERCHNGYFNSPTHMNGTLDTRSQMVNIVIMDIVGPKGSWASGTGQCSGVACHGSSTMDWYGTTSWTTPACTTCHSSAFSSVLDPVVTGGSDTTGKHEKHVTIYNYACSKCHQNYPNRPSHANGVRDTQDPSAQLIWFDATNPTGTWSNDTGPGTGACYSLSCHSIPAGLAFSYSFPGGDGNPVLNTVYTIGSASSITPSWYSTGILGCDACHDNPPRNGSTGSNIWHSGNHGGQGPTGDRNQCQFCHPDAMGSNGQGTAITNPSLHVNGAINVQATYTNACFGCH